MFHQGTLRTKLVGNQTNIFRFFGCSKLIIINMEVVDKRIYHPSSQKAFGIIRSGHKVGIHDEGQTMPGRVASWANVLTHWRTSNTRLKSCLLSPRNPKVGDNITATTWLSTEPTSTHVRRPPYNRYRTLSPISVGRLQTPSQSFT